MNTPSEEPTIHELLSRLAELEQAHARLQEELTNVQAERATVGAGALPELSNGTALAPGPTPGVFASSVAGTPAVKATGTNGADGVDATSDSGTGIFAQSSSFNAIHAIGGGTGVSALFAEGGTGFGVFATSDNTSGSGDGVRGSSHGSGNGVTGISALPGGTGNGVRGIGHTGDGVFGTSDSGNGVHGQSTSGIGVHAVGGGASPGTPPFGITEMAVFAEGGPNVGIVATNSSGSYAIIGLNTSFGTGVFGASSTGTGVAGESSTIGIGVFGSSGSSDGVFGSSASGTGVHGSTSTGFAGRFDGDVHVSGNFFVTGTKAFVQAHPTDPTREIVYVALEGGEAGTYVRGTGTLVNGKALLALPEHFGLVTATEGLTVQITPRGEWLQLYVVELDTAQLVVREAQGKSGAFDYLVYGVRRGYEQHEVIRTKR